MKHKGDVFFKNAMQVLFKNSAKVVDIGGGLRIDPKKNNRSLQNTWLKPLVEQVDYCVLDKVSSYNPDVIGDIHNLPFKDNSVDAFICISVLEHVEEPQKAMKEMYRVLKPGGYCYLWVPFLFYYHPEKGYYQDFYRFTIDGVKYLARDFSSVETCNSRGALATVFNLFPIFSKRTEFFSFFDRLLGKSESNQTSGYHVLCIK